MSCLRHHDNGAPTYTQEYLTESYAIWRCGTLINFSVVCRCSNYLKSWLLLHRDLGVATPIAAVPRQSRSAMLPELRHIDRSRPMAASRNRAAATNLYGYRRRMPPPARRVAALCAIPVIADHAQRERELPLTMRGLSLAPKILRLRIIPVRLRCRCFRNSRAVVAQQSFVEAMISGIRSLRPLVERH
jgi:hypothetical protein